MNIPHSLARSSKEAQSVVSVASPCLWRRRLLVRRAAAPTASATNSPEEDILGLLVRAQGNLEALKNIGHEKLVEKPGIDVDIQ